MITRRSRIVFFPPEPDAPPPLQVTLRRRVAFSDVDPLGILWHGRYAAYFEQGAAELGRRCGLSYRDFRDAGLRAPLARFHVEYLEPLLLDEEFDIRTMLFWSSGARLNTAHELLKTNGQVATRAWTVQMLTSAADQSVCLVPPPLLTRCQALWRAGAFADLQP